jgi:hypothetical protein
MSYRRGADTLFTMDTTESSHGNSNWVDATDVHDPSPSVSSDVHWVDAVDHSHDSAPAGQNNESKTGPSPAAHPDDHQDTSLTVDSSHDDHKGGGGGGSHNF